MLKTSGGLTIAAIVAALALTGWKGYGMDDCCISAPAGKKEPLSKGEPAVACTLTGEEARARRAEIARTLAAKAIETRELDNGYAIEFEDGYATELVEFIEFERECCHFFAFTLSFAPDKGPITLTITGPDGTKPFIERMLDAEE